MVVIEAALIGGVSQALGLVGGPGAVARADLRHQRAEFRLDDPVPRARGCSSCSRHCARPAATTLRPLSGPTGGRVPSEPMRIEHRMTRRRGARAASPWLAGRTRRCSNSRSAADRVEARRAGLRRRAARATTPATPTTASSGGTTPATSTATDGRRFGYQLTFFRSASTRRRPIRRDGPCATCSWRTSRSPISDGGRHRFAERLNRAGVGLGGRGDRRVRGVERGLGGAARRAGRHAAAGVATRRSAIDLRLAPRQAAGAPRRPRLQPEGVAAGQRLALLLADAHADARASCVGGERVRGRGPELDGPRVRHELPRDGPAGLGLVLDPAGRRHGSDAVPVAPCRRLSRSRRSSGTFVRPGQANRASCRGGFALEPGARWTSPASGARYPVEWRVSVPGEGLDLARPRGARGPGAAPARGRA